MYESGDEFGACIGMKGSSVSYESLTSAVSVREKAYVKGCECLVSMCDGMSEK